MGERGLSCLGPAIYGSCDSNASICLAAFVLGLWGWIADSSIDGFCPSSGTRNQQVLTPDLKPKIKGRHTEP